MEMTLLTKWWRHSRLVLTSVPQPRVDISGRGTQRARNVMSKVQALEEETMQWQCLETEDVDQRDQVRKCMRAAF